MKNLPNIEKSFFRRGEYVGYACGLVFRICKCEGAWVAYCGKTRRAAPTLALLSVALENVIV